MTSRCRGCTPRCKGSTASPTQPKHALANFCGVADLPALRIRSVAWSDVVAQETATEIVVGALGAVVALVVLPVDSDLARQLVVDPLTAVLGFLVAFQRVRFWREDEFANAAAWDEAAVVQTPLEHGMDLFLEPVMRGLLYVLPFLVFTGRGVIWGAAFMSVLTLVESRKYLSVVERYNRVAGRGSRSCQVERYAKETLTPIGLETAVSLLALVSVEAAAEFSPDLAVVVAASGLAAMLLVSFNTFRVHDLLTNPPFVIRLIGRDPRLCGEAWQLLSDVFEANELGSREEFASLMDKAEIFLLRREGRTLGVLLAEIRGGAAVIWWLGVSEAEQGRGYGSMLLEEAATEMGREGVQSLMLEAREDDAEADRRRTFYRRNGFYVLASGTYRVRFPDGSVVPYSLMARGSSLGVDAWRDLALWVFERAGGVDRTAFEASLDDALRSWPTP